MDACGAILGFLLVNQHVSINILLYQVFNDLYFKYRISNTHFRDEDGNSG